MDCHARMAAGVARANPRGTFWPLYKQTPDVSFQHQFIQAFSLSSIRACLVPRCSNGRQVPWQLGVVPFDLNKNPKEDPRRLRSRPGQHRATASSYTITPAQLHPTLPCSTSSHRTAAAPTSQGTVSQEGGHRQGASRHKDPAHPDLMRGLLESIPTRAARSGLSATLQRRRGLTLRGLEQPKSVSSLQRQPQSMLSTLSRHLLSIARL